MICQSFYTKVEMVDEMKTIAPKFKEKGEQIKVQFMKNIQQESPELLNIFYRYLQSTGQLQLSLVDVIYSGTMQIERMDKLVPKIMQIAHKHRSLGILPEYYPIIKKHLLSSIRKVAAGRVTKEQLNMIQLTYNRVADVLMQVEEDLYKEVETDSGWRFFKPFRIVKKQVENELEMSLYVVPIDGKLKSIEGVGQYVTARLKVPDDIYYMNHQYAVAVEPKLRGYVLSICRGPGYYTNDRVTHYIFDELIEGDLLEVSAPAGVVTC
ncbi:MAG: hypothetical protein RR595_12250 [Lysinibacillus sp.]